MRIALGLEYDGSRFLGWQTQPGGGAVQDALEPALGAIAGEPRRLDSPAARRRRDARGRRAARRRARFLGIPLGGVPGQVAAAHPAFARHRAPRRAHRLRAAGERVPAPHGAQHRRHARLCRQGQASGALGEGRARVARSDARGADLRAGRTLPGGRGVRREMGTAPMRTRVKICGITRRQDARAAAEEGADAIGLVFYPPSRRFVRVERALGVRDALPPFVQTVALFVSPDAAQVAQVIGRVRPAMLQFHGEEEPQFCAQFGVPWVKACRVRRGIDLLKYLRPFSAAAAWLLDSHVEEYGRAGASFDWSLVPAARDRPLILLGRLARDNVAQAIRPGPAWGGDVSSGVESAKGIKDAAKIAAFIADRKSTRLNSS